AVYGSVLMATNRTQWVTYTAFMGLAINLILNHFWITKFGSVGAAWSTVVSLYVVVAVMLPQIAQALQTSIKYLFPMKHLLKVAVATLASMSVVAGAKRLLELNGPLGMGLWMILYGGIGLALYRVMGLPSLRDIVNFLKRRAS
ncbi:MAG: polysaccharide biosynthesis C-terminal domain-containing protein, partial [Bradymonadia bacterium]